LLSPWRARHQPISLTARRLLPLAPQVSQVGNAALVERERAFNIQVAGITTIVLSVAALAVILFSMWQDQTSGSLILNVAPP
jgi:hypothetical protein